MILPDTDTHFKPSDWDTYQLYQYEYAVGLCKQRRTALDCGAHVGIMTHRMTQTFRNTHAFEPYWHHYLSENMQAYSNWELHTVALGATQGRTGIEPNHTNTGGTKIVPGDLLQLKTIDSYNFQGVDFIKMDLEGSELDALTGGQHTIQQWHPVLLIELEKHSQQRHLVESLLNSWGYEERLRKNADTIWTT